MDKQQTLEHLEYMVEDIQNFVIPAQTSQETIDLFKKDQEAIESAIELIKKQA